MSAKLLFAVLCLCVLVPSVLGGCDYTLNWGAFSRDSPFLVATANGYFAAQNVCVLYHQVTGSIQQFDSLLSGAYDIVNTAADNVANRVVNQGLNLTIVAGVDLGIGLDLVVNVNNVTTWSDLVNLPIAVDAPDSGFVLDLLYMARANGIAINTTLFQLVGGAFARFLDLVAGKWVNPATNQTESVVASMLVNPFTVRISPPLQIFAKFSDYVAPYQNSVLAVTSAWLQVSSNQEALRRVLVAWSQAQMFISNPANRDAVIAILQTSGLNLGQASASYAEITYPPSALNPNCLASILGLENIISVRQSLGYFNTPVSPKNFVKNNQPFGFYDSRFCHQALGLLNADTTEDDGIYN